MPEKKYRVAEYDAGLIAAIAADMDLRKPNLLALDTIAGELGTAGGASWRGVCDIATAVGKTYLAAALIDYLAESSAAVRHFLIVVPNKTIYQKTIDNYTSGHAKSVIGGMRSAPVVITPDNFDAAWVAAALDDETQVKVFIFKIQGLTESTSKSSKRTRDQDNERLGGSLYSRLQEVDDLVVLSDEHHMYAAKAKAFFKAVDDLGPLALVGLTATPDRSQLPDVVYNYSLAQALADKLVKTPVIVGRTDEHNDLDTRLRDGILLLDAKKLAADAYATAEGKAAVRPVMLVVTRDIPEAEAVTARLRQRDMLSDDEVLEVHSDVDDEELARLLAVEDADSRVRVIVSVNMLGVGWDVKNVFVILSLRKSVSEVLTEQTLGRGLRLPWGGYTDVELLDTLEVLAHERYHELLAKADKLLEGLVDEGKVDSEKAAAAARRRGAREAAAAALAAAAAAAETLAASQSGSGDTAPGESNSGADDALKEVPPSEIADSDKRLAQAAAEAAALKQNVVAPRQDVVLELPVVTTVLQPAVFSLSTIGESGFEEVGRRLAAGESATLLRELLDVQEAEGGELKYAPRHAADLLAASAADMAEGAVADTLRIAMIESKLVPANSQNAGAARRLANVLVAAAGGEKALAPHLSSALSAVNVLLVKAQSELTPTKTNTVALQPFAPYRPNIRPLESNRHATFSRSFAYEGWERGLHSVAWFDSKTERDAANIFDGDADVEVWARLLGDDLPVRWQSGIYQPDFYLRTISGEHFVVEVKADRELTTVVVQAKKKAAVEWVQTVEDAGFGRWRYLLLPEEAVATAKTFEQLRRRAR